MASGSRRSRRSHGLEQMHVGAADRQFAAMAAQIAALRKFRKK